MHSGCLHTAQGDLVKQTPGGGKKTSREETSGTSTGADAAGKCAKRAKKSIATPPAEDKAKKLVNSHGDLQLCCCCFYVPGKLKTLQSRASRTVVISVVGCNGAGSISVLVQIDPAEFDGIIAVVKKQLFNDSVPKERYIKLQQVSSSVLQSLMQNACLAQVLQCSAFETKARCE